MLDPRNPFMLALLRGEEASLVGREHMERLAAASSDADAQAALHDSDLGAYLSTAVYGSSRQRDQALWSYLAAKISSLENQPFLPPDARRFSGAYVLKYDVANLKAVLQGMALEHTAELLPIGAIAAHHRLDALAAAETAGDVAEVLMQAGLALFGTAVRSFNPAAGAKARQATEAGLEGIYHRHLLRTAQDLGGGIVLAKACGMKIDFANLSILFRALLFNGDPGAGVPFIAGGYLIGTGRLREALAHGVRDVPRWMDDSLYRVVAMEVVDAWEKSGAVACIDQVIERHRLTALRGLLAPQVAPAAAMAWFLIVKEIELRNVRLLLKSVDGGVTLDDIRKHLLW
jgi:vacuolar-type H+-ATPase subunit C/Vma6